MTYFSCEKRGHFKNLCVTKADCKVNEAEVGISVFLGSVTAAMYDLTWSRQSESAIENRVGGLILPSFQNTCSTRPMKEISPNWKLIKKK